MSIIPPAAVADQAMWAARQTVRQGSPAEAQPVDSAAQIKSGQAQSIQTKEAGQKFEALYLRQMLEEWMPKDSDTLFGEGTAGTVWRSMMVDSLATTLSKSGTIGIAPMIFKPEPDGSRGK
ncbi:rod-binding protein [Hyphomicrobium sp. 99]|uniref:rod-binding protein n=1 Tax=Hyphomicrobium sp. 99 TaxID=1163419 RepID=UPI0005F78E35|nr:rod-binding protein [Hyphomicrobium sp. 99]